jgi:hypothetical protein
MVPSQNVVPPFEDGESPISDSESNFAPHKVDPNPKPGAHSFLEQFFAHKTSRTPASTAKEFLNFPTS